MNTYEQGDVQILMTLSYDNRFIPYVKLEDLKNGEIELPVYRDYDCKKVRVSKNYTFGDKLIQNDSPITYVRVLPYSDDDISKVRELQDKPSCVGICHYKDVQDFLKRFDSYYKYNFCKNGTKPKFRRYVCSEYGGKKARPHFHVLWFSKPNEVDNIRQAFLATWRFQDYHALGLDNVFKVGAGFQKYVAAYVNSSSYVSDLFEQKPLRPKHTSSRNFSASKDFFSLDSIEEKVKQGTFIFDREFIEDGVRTRRSFLGPSSVISRYFPKLHGYSRLDNDTLANLIVYPGKILHSPLRYNFEEDVLRKDIVSIVNHFRKWCDIKGIHYGFSSRLAYAAAFVRTWQTYYNTIMAEFYRNNDHVPQMYQYDNISELFGGRIINETLLDRICEEGCTHEVIEDCNKFPQNLRRTRELEDEYYSRDKSKRVKGVIRHITNPNF